MRISLVILTILIHYSAVCQQESIKCSIIKSFVTDEKILDLLDMKLAKIDTVFIVDSTHKLNSCKSLLVNNFKTIILVEDYSGDLNIDPEIRNDLIMWNNKIMIYNFERKSNYYEIFFFYKPTNALGSVIYKTRKHKIVHKKYRLGQL